MECVEAVESENRLRPIKRGREPAGTQKLSMLADEPVCLTVTEIKRNVMDSGCVKDAEVFRSGGWKRTWSTAVPKLNTKT